MIIYAMFDFCLRYINFIVAATRKTGGGDYNDLTLSDISIFRNTKNSNALNRLKPI